MKRQSILALCAFVTLGAFAQEAIVKDVEKAIGGLNPDVNTLKAACSNIKPALDNPETKDDAKTWAVAGKANFALFDNQQTQMMMKKDYDPVLMGNALIEGFDYFRTALPLDSVKQKEKNGEYKREKDGSIKVKTKYSKEIVNTLITRHNDFQVVGSILYDAKKYKEAATAWGIYAAIPYSGLADRDKFAVPDSTIGQIEYYQAIASWQGEDLKTAVKAFKSCINHGYQAKEAYDYAMNCYAQLQDNDGIVAIAEAALPLYGDKDTQYIKILINDKLNKEKFLEAEELINRALSQNPNSAELINLQGLIAEQKQEEAKALELFEKASQLDPTYSEGFFNAGRMIMKKAVAKQKEMETMDRQTYAKTLENELKPLLEQARPYIEKAYSLDKENSNAKRILSNIYYLLGDEAALNSLEN